VAAAAALLDLALDRLDRVGERLVLLLGVGATVVGDRLGGVADLVELAAEQAVGRSQEALPLLLDVLRVRGAVAVAAALAVELELIPLEVREVAEIVGERHDLAHLLIQPHHGPPFHEVPSVASRRWCGVVVSRPRPQGPPWPSCSRRGMTRPAPSSPAPPGWSARSFRSRPTPPSSASASTRWSSGW